MKVGDRVEVTRTYFQESEYVIRKMQANGWKPTME